MVSSLRNRYRGLKMKSARMLRFLCLLSASALAQSTTAVAAADLISQAASAPAQHPAMAVAQPQAASQPFPPPPPNDEASQQTNYGPGTYPAIRGNARPATGMTTDNGIAPLPPLAPPPMGRTGQTEMSPFTPAEIVQMRKQYDRTRKAKAHHPVRAVPRISSISVDLSPGAAPPIARMMPGEMSTILFLDASGNPWPLAAAPRVSDGRFFDAEWLRGTSTVIISALSPYEDGNLSVMLKDFPTPIVIKLATGEPDSREKTRIVDYRLDLRIPGRAPGAPAGVIGQRKIALYDDTMQQFLDGLPPKPAKVVKTIGSTSARTQVWELEGALFVRTALDIQTAFDQSIAAGDGTRVYRLPPTPFVTLSDGSRSITLQLDID